MGIDLQISVNISASHLQQNDFPTRLAALLTAHPEAPPHRLELEILETSALKSINRVSTTMLACTKLGVSFSIDDFGTGYSSLTYLRHLPADLIKIDQSFTQSLHKTRTRAIVQSIVSLAHNLQLEVLAEGVETLEQSSILQEMECHYLQGYYYGRPDVIHEVTPFLKI